MSDRNWSGVGWFRPMLFPAATAGGAGGLGLWMNIGM